MEKTGDGRVRRPAAYKTGTTNDRKDTAAYGYLAAAGGPERAGARRRRLDGQLRLRRRTTTACRSSRRRRCGRAIMTEISQDLPIAKFKRPGRASSK